LAFDLEVDPEEQHNLLQCEVDAKTKAALDEMAELAARSINFDRAAEDREAKGRTLEKQYPLPKNRAVNPGNIYTLPDGRIIDANRIIYEPLVVIDDPSAAYSDWPSS
jgi:hypothetical protein